MSFELIFGLLVVAVLNIAEFKRILSPSKIDRFHVTSSLSKIKN